jgi:hypothetical protein
VQVLLTLSGGIFVPPGLRDAKIKSDEPRRESRCQSNRLESIIATDALTFKTKRSVLREIGIDASSTKDP